MQIRPLTPDDAAYRTLRLEALQKCPTAYVTDFQEDAPLRLEEFQARLEPSESSLTFGAFDGDQLVGLATLLRPARLRLNFRTTIVGMYVAESHRRSGLASRLVAACLDRARGLPGVEEVCLCVTVGNDAARRTYLACGFQPEYIEPRYFKYEGRFFDLEWLRFPLV